ncbi:choice-of-anchor L domain-containing protein [Crocinitomix catalasitica]|nr:choice-of-anchor L domain-containing protein [Crocinitomix catalasitica]MBN4077645.1 choice-of-anchor L domain-containing protein [bacterium AH-315-C20]
MKELKRHLLLVVLLFGSAGFSQIIVTNTQTPAQLVQDVLVGGGVGVTGIEYNYSAAAAATITDRMGYFDASGTGFPIQKGIIIATGKVSMADGFLTGSGNTVANGTENSTTGDPVVVDPDLNAIGTTTLFDETVLEFDISVTGDSLLFQYVFASEEYPEFVGSAFNDVFGFFVSGPGISGPYSGGAENIALIPGTVTPVAINNVNNGSTDSGPCTNCAYYIQNSVPPGADVEYDGYTVSLKAAAKVECAGVYHVKLCIADAGDGAYDSAIFLEENSLNSMGLVFNYNEPTCYGFSDGSIVVNVVGGEGGYAFDITDEDDITQNIGNSNAANNLTEGWYTISVVDTIGCGAAEDSIYIGEPNEMTVDLNITHVLCNGDATGWVVVDTVDWHQGPFSSVSYDWSTGPPGGIGANSDTLLTAGQYTLDLTDAFGCAASIVFVVTEPPPLEFSQIGYEPAYCRLYSYQVGNGQVYAAGTGGTPDYTYLWTKLGSSPLETSINTTWGGLNPGDYSMTVTDGNGCTLTQVVTLDSVNPEAVLDIISDSLNQDLMGTAPVCISVTDTNSLYFANPLNPIADTSFWLSFDYPDDDYFLIQGTEMYYNTYDTCYTEAGEYLVCLKTQNKNGCKDEVCHLITVWPALDITPPNIFTPNNDGINDVFTFEFLAKGVKTFECTIVDRWGVTMAEINDILDGWDGTDKSGSRCQDGVYFYVYSGTAFNDKPFQGQGNIQIISSRINK